LEPFPLKESVLGAVCVIEGQQEIAVKPFGHREGAAFAAKTPGQPQQRKKPPRRERLYLGLNHPPALKDDGRYPWPPIVNGPLWNGGFLRVLKSRRWRWSATAVVV
jgi:hypothetical protein